MIFGDVITKIEPKVKMPPCGMCMALKRQGWEDGVTCNHAWAIVKWGSFPTAILEILKERQG